MTKFYDPQTERAVLTELRAERDRLALSLDTPRVIRFDHRVYYRLELARLNAAIARRIIPRAVSGHIQLDRD
jgi:hypothetical protein